MWLLRICGVFFIQLVWLQSLHAETTLTLAHMFAKDSLPDMVAQRFADNVASQSSGEITIKIYSDGYLGDERKNLLSMSNDSLDLAVTGDLVISFYLPEYAVVNMPFIYRDVDHALKVYDGKIGQEIASRLQQNHSIRPLSWHYVGTRVLTSNRKISNLQQLNKLNLRLPPDRVWTESWKALGVLPKPIPFTDLVAALQRGRVEAQENPPNFIRNKEMNKVQKYLIMTNHMPQRQFILINEQLFSNKLTTEQQQMLKQAAVEASNWLTATAKQQQEQDLQWLQNQGSMEIVPFDATGVAAALESIPARLSAMGQQLYREIVAVK